MNGKYLEKKRKQKSQLLRNDFYMVGKWGMPLIKKSEIDVNDISLIGSDKIRIEETRVDIASTVHFFVEDSKLDRYYNNPEKYLERLAQYPNVLTPDYSLYTDMPMAIQIQNTFKNRWCGAYWQEYGLSVIPSVSWSTAESFDFCFDGLEYGTVVAVSTLGCRREKDLFLKGYYELKKRIAPKQVLCFSKAFPEMGEEVIEVSYEAVTRRKK